MAWLYKYIVSGRVCQEWRQQHDYTTCNGFHALWRYSSHSVCTFFLSGINTLAAGMSTKNGDSNDESVVGSRLVNHVASFCPCIFFITIIVTPWVVGSRTFPMTKC